ncbi:MAG: hypothetical protein U1A78_08220 [Polyangia bacterium]
MRSPSRCPHGFWGLPFAAVLVLGGAVLTGSGCGETAERSLTLLSPVLEPCNKSRDPSCTDTFFGCADLKAEQLTFSVGLFDKESTTVACPPELSSGSATVKIRYRPGLRFYAVDTSYSREDEQLNVTAGPFAEDEAATPWRMKLK